MKILILILLAALAIYLLGAFISMEINPGNWHEEGRMIAVFILGSCALIIFFKDEINKS